MNGICTIRLLLLVSTLMLLSACGQKGDLYLPDEQAQLAQVQR